MASTHQSKSLLRCSKAASHKFQDDGHNFRASRYKHQVFTTVLVELQALCFLNDFGCTFCQTRRVALQAESKRIILHQSLHPLIRHVPGSLATPAHQVEPHQQHLCLWLEHRSRASPQWLVLHCLATRKQLPASDSNCIAPGPICSLGTMFQHEEVCCLQ